MTIALWCVLVAALLPYVANAIARAGGSGDTHEPRNWMAQQSGFRRRAEAASLNSFEVFPLFAAGVIIARVVRGPQHLADLIAVAFVVLRLLYIACYLADKPPLRSSVFMLGLLCSISLFVISA